MRFIRTWIVIILTAALVISGMSIETSAKDKDDSNAAFAEGRIIVMYDSSAVSETEKEKDKKELKLKTEKILKDKRIELLTFDKSRKVEDVINKLREKKGVISVEKDYIMEAYVDSQEGLFVPNDPFFDPYQWNMKGSDNGGINAWNVWPASIGQGITVAVIDTGVAYEDYTQKNW